MRLSRLWLPVLSAVLFQLSFPATDLRFLAFVCLVPWFVYLSDCSAKQAFWSGYLMGFLIVLGQMSWLLSLISRWTGSGGLSLIPWILCGFLGGFYFAFVGVLTRSSLLRRWYWAIPVIWAGVEVGRSYIPALAFPWFLLASPLTPYPALDQLAFFGTIYFVSGWVCLVNVCLYLVGAHFLKGRSPLSDFSAPSAWHVFGYGGVALVLCALSLAWYGRPESGRLVRFTVGQPGFDFAFGDQSRKDVELEARVARLYEVARRAGSILLVLPEGVSEGGVFPPAPPFDLEDDPPVLFGGQRGVGPAYQTAFLYNHGQWSFADKSRLVVFGEYVPGREYLPFLKDFKLPSGDLIPAGKVTALQLDGITIGPLLCFEGLFWDVAHKQAENGSQVLAVMSIDDWYMGTPAPEQLAEGTVWRAIESGLPVLRSASTGYTMAVDGRGRELGSVPLGDWQVLNVEVHVEDRPLRNPWRPLFPWLAGFFPYVFGTVLWLWRWRLRRPKSGVLEL